MTRGAVTPIGESMRNLRKRHHERLADMAKRLKKSVAFISAVELGRSSPPAQFADALIKAYGLTGEEAEEVFIAADHSTTNFRFAAKNQQEGELMGLMARKIRNMPEDDFERIRRILLGEENERRSA